VSEEGWIAALQVLPVPDQRAVLERRLRDVREQLAAGRDGEDADDVELAGLRLQLAALMYAAAVEAIPTGPGEEVAP
jgi:hypothetical protein